MNLSVEALLAAGQQPPAGYVKRGFAPHLDDGGELLLGEGGVDLKIGGTFGAHPFNEGEGFGDGSAADDVRVHAGLNRRAAFLQACQPCVLRVIFTHSASPSL